MTLSFPAPPDCNPATAAPMLVQVLHENLAARRAAIRALAHQPERLDPAQIERLGRTALADPDARAREDAAAVLSLAARLGIPGASAALAVLLWPAHDRAAAESSSLVRELAAAGLEQAPVPELTRLEIASLRRAALSDPSADVRRTAVDAIGRAVRHDRDGALDALCSLLAPAGSSDRLSRYTRAQACHAMAEAFCAPGSPDLRAALVQRLGDGETGRTLLAAASRLSDLQLRSDPRLRADLLALAERTGDDALRSRVARCLAQAALPDAPTLLLELGALRRVPELSVTPSPEETLP
jgi:hypothetical protein